MLLSRLPVNPIIFGTLIAWLFAQLLKIFIVFIEDRRWNFKRFMGSGGMPSSHTTGIVTAATLLYRYEGGMSSVFGITVIIGFVIMYDASGVRREAGNHAEILNILLEKWDDTTIVRKKFKELIGHTPVEVIAGAALGMMIGAVL